MIDAFEKKTLNSLVARNVNLSKETTSNLKKLSSVIFFDEDDKNNEPQYEDLFEQIIGKEHAFNK